MICSQIAKRLSVGEQKENAQSRPKNAARGPATLEPHRFVNFKTASPLLSVAERPQRPDSTHIFRECHIYRCHCRTMIPRTTALQLRGDQRPNPAQRAGSGGGRNAWATQKRSRVSDFPPAIHPRELPVCHWPRRKSSFGKPRKVYVFGESTVRHSVTSRNRKTFRACAEPVEDDTCLWKPEENASRNYANHVWARDDSIT
jgi:hypothetical protein